MVARLSMSIKPKTSQFILTLQRYFNCQDTEWGYTHTSPDGECLSDWEAKENRSLLYNPKTYSLLIFWSWNTGTNPNLGFASKYLNRSELERRLLERFLKPQHRSSLITASKSLAPVPSEPYKR